MHLINLLPTFEVSKSTSMIIIFENIHKSTYWWLAEFQKIQESNKLITDKEVTLQNRFTEF